MALDDRYILQQDLETLLIDKTTGLPLANGTIEFWSDDARNTPKAVYQLSGAPPNYTFSPLPNPLPLSIVGTPSNGAGDDNIAVYYFPYDTMGNLELYYVVVKDSNGLIQFTREAWPNISDGNNPVNSGSVAAVNMLSNPQFVDVNFNASQPLTINVGASIDVGIAPGWHLLALSGGAGTVQVTRNAIAGDVQAPTNPAYSLEILPGGGVTSLMLYQRLYNNTNVWSEVTAAGSNGWLGWVSSSLSFGPEMGPVQMFYSPHNGLQTQLLAGTNSSGQFQTFNQAVQLPQGNSTDTSDVGYIDIQIILPVGARTTLSSVQCIATPSQQVLPYDQQPANRQRDYLAHYYKPLLAYKPIPSYLVGWDFPKNPAQIFGPTVAASAIGANKSKYVWDQTILFQTADNSMGVSRGANGGLVTTATADGQMAIIQYLDQIEARKLLSDRMSVHISGSTTHAGAPLAGKVTLWATTDANLPNVNPGTNNSLVTALDATGFPTCGNGTWVQITRNGLGDASFSLTAASATNSELADININGWDLLGAVPVNTATFFAIVVGFAQILNTETVTLNSIGLCAGDIATRPAPKTLGGTLLDCQRYFYSTFPAGAIPATNYGANTGYPQFVLPSTRGVFYSDKYPVPMRVSPTIKIYNPVVANNQIRNLSTNADCTVSAAAANASAKTLDVSAAPDGGAASGDLLGFHATADARLGIVN